MQRAKDAAEAWLAALMPEGVPPSRVRAAADALDEVAVLGRMLLRERAREDLCFDCGGALMGDKLRYCPACLERDSSVTPEAPSSHAGVTPAEDPSPPDLIPEAENRTPLKSVSGVSRHRGRAPLDYSGHPLGLLSETLISRVTGVTQATLSVAARRAGVPSRNGKRTNMEGRWALLYEEWGKARALAWFDGAGKAPAARQLREQFLAYAATREPETPADVDEEDEPSPHAITLPSIMLPSIRLSKLEISVGKDLDDFAPFPKTRADCVNGPRPCPFARCRYHLAVEVKESGSLRLVHGHDDITELRDTCALDLADRGGMTLEEVAGALNVTRERARQIEVMAFEKLRAAEVAAV